MRPMRFAQADTPWPGEAWVLRNAEGGAVKKVVTPRAKRRAAGVMDQGFRRSQRQACRLVAMWRSTCRYPSRRAPDEVVITRLRDRASEHPRWGYRILTDLLRSEGLRVNHERVRKALSPAGPGPASPWPRAADSGA